MTEIEFIANDVLREEFREEEVDIEYVMSLINYTFICQSHGPETKPMIRFHLTIDNHRSIPFEFDILFETLSDEEDNKTKLKENIVEYRRQLHEFELAGGDDDDDPGLYEL